MRMRREDVKDYDRPMLTRRKHIPILCNRQPIWATRKLNGECMRFRSLTKTCLTCLLVPLATLLTVTPRTSHAQGKPIAAMSPELQAAKAALAKYSDPIVAVRDGYFSTLACIDFPTGAKDGTIEYPPGAMGVHFLKAENIGPTLDPAKPQVLIYEPVGDK